MWYWIEGIKNAKAKQAQRILYKEREEREEKKWRKTMEANEYVFSELQIQVNQAKEELQKEQTIKKQVQSELKRVEFMHRKEIKKKNEEIEIWKNKCKQISQVPREDHSTTEAVAVPLNGSNSSIPNSLSKSMTDEESKELFDILQSSEEEIKGLKKKTHELEKHNKNQMNEFGKARESNDLLLRRVDNEILDLRQKLDLEITMKSALQSNNKELDKEIKRLQRLLQVRGNGGPPWVPDWFVDACSGCTSAFTIIRRRHHCRQCGNIFCSTCSNNQAIIPSDYYHNVRVRVCNECFAALKSNNSSLLKIPSAPINSTPERLAPPPGKESTKRLSILFNNPFTFPLEYEQKKTEEC